jgi:hypothetical protein
MRMVTIEKEWAEVRRNGRKTEDWSWTVTFYEGEMIEMNDWIDQHYYKTEEIAVERMKMFDEGRYEIGQYGEVTFPSVEE